MDDDFVMTITNNDDEKAFYVVIADTDGTVRRSFKIEDGTPLMTSFGRFTNDIWLTDAIGGGLTEAVLPES